MEWDSAGRGFNGTKLRWSQLEQILSGSAPSADDAASVHSPAREAPEMDTDPQKQPPSPSRNSMPTATTTSSMGHQRQRIWCVRHNASG